MDSIGCGVWLLLLLLATGTNANVSTVRLPPPLWEISGNDASEIACVSNKTALCEDSLRAIMKQRVEEIAEQVKFLQGCLEDARIPECGFHGCVVNAIGDGDEGVKKTHLEVRCSKIHGDEHVPYIEVVAAVISTTPPAPLFVVLDYHEDSSLPYHSAADEDGTQTTISDALGVHHCKCTLLLLSILLIS